MTEQEYNAGEPNHPRPDPAWEPYDEANDQRRQEEGPLLWFDPVAHAAHLASLDQ